jgi:hypothetical protein
VAAVGKHGTSNDGLRRHSIDVSGFGKRHWEGVVCFEKKMTLCEKLEGKRNGIGRFINCLMLQCHVRSGTVMCSLVTCQTDEHNRSTSVFKTEEHSLNYVRRTRRMNVSFL